jgi:hypothetical protein
VEKGRGKIEVSSDEPSRDESPRIGDSTEGGKKNIVQEILDGDKPLLGDDKRQDAIKSFDKLPHQIKDMMARTVGMKDGTNATAVVEKLMDEGRLYEGDDDGQFSMRAKTDDFENIEVFINNDFAEVNAFVSSLLPESTRKKPLKEEYIDAIFSEVLGKDTFNPTERKPQAVPGGYLIRGESKVKSKEGQDDGDLLIEALDKKIAASSVAGKIQAFYILDPTPPSGEEEQRRAARRRTPRRARPHWQRQPQQQPQSRQQQHHHHHHQRLEHRQGQDRRRQRRHLRDRQRDLRRGRLWQRLGRPRRRRFFISTRMAPSNGRARAETLASFQRISTACKRA